MTLWQSAAIKPIQVDLGCTAAPNGKGGVHKEDPEVGGWVGRWVGAWKEGCVCVCVLPRAWRC